VSAASDSTRRATAAAQLVRTAARDSAARDLAATSAARGAAAAALASAHGAENAARAELAAHATRPGAHDARSRFERDALEGVVRTAVERVARAERIDADAAHALREAQARLELAERDVKVIERIDERLDSRDALERRRRLGFVND
jgi:hypothetical protein